MYLDALQIKLDITHWMVKDNISHLIDLNRKLDSFIVNLYSTLFIKLFHLKQCLLDYIGMFALFVRRLVKKLKCSLTSLH